jgi:hypothetical protein
MDDQKQSQPKLLLDALIVGVTIGLLGLALWLGPEAGHPATKGLGSVIGGLYVAYFGALFLLSYFFPNACYVFSFLSYVCTARSHPASRHMALCYFALGLFLGLYLVLVGLGVL